MSHVELVVNPIGKQAPVVTSYVEYLMREGIVEKPNVIIVSTKDPDVLAQAAVAKAAIISRYRCKVSVVVHESPIEDVVDLESLTTYFDELGKAILKFIKRGAKVSIYYNATGGRKSMAVMGTVFFALIGRTLLSYVYNKNVDVLNTALQEVEHIIRKFSTEMSDKELERLYRRYQSELDPIMFPRRCKYNVINIPIPPYPGSLLGFLIDVGRGASIDKLKTHQVPDVVIKNLDDLDIIEVGVSNIIPGKNYELIRPALFVVDKILHTEK